MTRLLLIEDEEVILRALTRLLERHRYETVAVRDIDAAEAADPHGFDLILADLRLPGRDGTAIIPLADPVPVVVMTSHASVRSAVEAMRAGASDYIAKPFDHDELLLVLERARSRHLLGARNRALERDLERAEPAARRIAGTSLEPLVTALAEAPDASAPLHLHGEPGSGREDVARQLHARGPHARTPLTVVDGVGADASAAAPGAAANTVARGGTLVLRHPERLARSAQETLAAPLGAATTAGRSVPAAPSRLVTIAREPVATLRERGVLCPALAACLAGRQREVVPLRRRRGDVAVLARRAAAALGRRHAGCPATLSDAAVAALGARDWPDNLLSLEGAVERAVLRAIGSGACTDAGAAAGAATLEGVPGVPDAVLALPDEWFEVLPTELGELDLDAYFRYAVLRLQGRLSETDLAARLGISRKALWERRHRMHLPRPGNESSNR